MAAAAMEPEKLQGKAGEILGLPRATPGRRVGQSLLQPSTTATANLPLCNTSGGVNHNDQKIRINMNLMLTKE